MTIRILFILPFLLALPVRADWQENIDTSSLKDRAGFIRGHLSLSPPSELVSYIDGFDTEKATAPFPTDSVQTEPCTSRSVPSMLRIKGITHKRLILPSAQPSDPKPAVFYVCAKPGPVKGRKALLWVPGMGVSKFAFFFIRGFLEAALERDYLVVFYVPPLHMDRLPRGQKPGEGFFNGDPLHDIRRILDCVRELRTAASWLRAHEVGKISGWGGSMGAPMISLLSRFERLDHLCLMIPVLDWTESWVKNPLFAALLEDIEKAGYSEQLLSRGYGLISPARYPLSLPPQRVLLLLAAKDKLNPIRSAMDYSRERRIDAVRIYPRSHGTILIEKQMFRDYEAFLDAME